MPPTRDDGYLDPDDVSAASPTTARGGDAIDRSLSKTRSSATSSVSVNGAAEEGDDENVVPEQSGTTYLPEDSQQPLVRSTNPAQPTSFKLRSVLGGRLLSKGCIAGATDLAGLADLLSGPLCGKDCPLGGRTIRAPRTSTPQCSHWLAANLWPREADVTYQSALAGLYHLAASNDHAQNTAEISVSPRTPDLGVRGRMARRAQSSVTEKLLEDSKTAASRGFRNVHKLLKAPGLRGGEAVVCVVTGGGTRLRDGTLKLPQNAVLLLDESCRGVSFQNVSFSGGVVVCHGANCHANFTDVRLMRSTLVATAGAHVTLKGASFTRPRSGGTGVAIFAHGSGTSVNLKGGSITGGAQGATVQAGASFNIEDVTITHTSVTGLEVSGDNSSLNVSNCQIHSFSAHHLKPRDKALQVVRGVRVLTGATAELSACCVAGAQWGFDIYSAYEPPRVAPLGDSPQNTEVDNYDLSSFSCSNSSGSSAVTPAHSRLWDGPTGEGTAGRVHTAIATKATLRDCSATDCALQGLRVEGSLVDASAFGCDFSRNAKGGVVVMSGSHLTADECTTSNNKDAGFRASGTDTRMDLSNCSTSSDLRGCEASSKGVMHAVDVVATNATQEGFAVFSQAEMTGCTAIGSGLQGMLVSGINSTAALKRCNFRGNGKSGALARMCGMFSAESCSSCTNEGPAYAVQGSISCAELKACEGTGGAWGCMDRTGALMLPCTVDVNGTEVDGFRTFDGSSITLRDCDRNCAKTFFDVTVKSDPSKSLPPEVTQIAVNARGIFFHPQMPRNPRCVYGICLNDIQCFSYATKKEQTFTIKARPRGYHASLHLLQFETDRGRDISDLLIAITNKWLLM